MVVDWSEVNSRINQSLLNSVVFEERARFYLAESSRLLREAEAEYVEFLERRRHYDPWVHGPLPMERMRGDAIFLGRLLIW